MRGREGGRKGRREEGRGKEGKEGRGKREGGKGVKREGRENKRGWEEGNMVMLSAHTGQSVRSSLT